MYNPDRTIKKFKAQIAARRDQLENIFDPDTYIGIASSPTLRILQSIAAEEDIDLVSHNIKTAFLYSSLKSDENIYLKRSTGANDDIRPPVVKSIKWIYGLPQVSKYFDDHLSSTLMSTGVTRCITDSEFPPSDVVLTKSF